MPVMGHSAGLAAPIRTVKRPCLEPNASLRSSQDRFSLPDLGPTPIGRRSTIIPRILTIPQNALESCAAGGASVAAETSLVQRIGNTCTLSQERNEERKLRGKSSGAMSRVPCQSATAWPTEEAPGISRVPAQIWPVLRPFRPHRVVAKRMMPVTTAAPPAVMPA